MVREPQSLDITAIPQLAELAEEVQRTGQPRALQRNGETLAYLEPAPQVSGERHTGGARRKRSRHGERFTTSDPLWDFVGMATSEGPGDVAENKHKYLAEAYAPKGE